MMHVHRGKEIHMVRVMDILEENRRFVFGVKYS